MSKEQKKAIDTLIRLHDLPYDLKMFYIYMGEFVKTGKEPDIQWLYAQARGLRIPTECVSKIAAFARRYCYAMGWEEG